MMPGMGLRARLALFFVAITVIPLAVALLVLQVQVTEQLRQRARGDLSVLERAAVSQLDLVRRRAGDVATDIAGVEAGVALAENDREAAQAWLEGEVAGLVGTRSDFVVLAQPDGGVLAAVLSPPEADDPEAFPDAARLAAAAPARSEPPRALLEVREVRGRAGDEPERLLGYVVSGTWVDRGLLEVLAPPTGAAIAVGEDITAAVDVSAAALERAGLPGSSPARSVVEIDGRRQLVTSVRLGDLDGSVPGTVLLLLTPVGEPGSPLRLALLLLVPSVLVAGGIGWLLASAVVHPVRRAADVARAVADGDLQQTLEPSGGHELGDLAVALNAMTDNLAARLDELERSRSELRRSLSRLGETLSSSLDLNRMLAVVVETAIETLAAQRGMLMLFTPERDALYLKVGRGVGDVPRLAVGEGLIGNAAQTASSYRLPADAADAPAHAPGEPTAPFQLAVPMLGRGRVMGVLSLFRDGEDTPFTQDDLDTVRSFAAQASVAIENVMLHQEAQRLSVTDALTGLWNFRYFQMQADRELESATRFGRPLSLAIVDIDHFKIVNDHYGHQVGDDVLIEVAQRLRLCTRVPDVVARYGGEEFVVLLPNTGVDGALATAERIREAISGTPIAYGHRAGLPAGQLEITCSVGVATFPDHGRTMAALLRSADAAMYGAKTAGRNRVVGAGSSTNGSIA